jgi:hypothetical protein
LGKVSASESARRQRAIFDARSDPQKAANIVKLFERIRGRRATPEEIANVERTLNAPDV